MKTFFHKIPMVESKPDSAKKQPIPFLRHKSPLRQHENVNNMNIIIQSPKSRKSLSPLRGRKKTTEFNLPSTAKSMRKCENHQTKNGNFMVESEQEILHYCKNCAVRLASQGFEVKSVEIEEKDEKQERVEEVNKFMDEVQLTISGLNQKKSMIGDVIEKGEEGLDSEINKIKEYYAQFYSIIKEHQSRVIEELTSEYDSASQRTKDFMHQIDEALENSQAMKKDILQSLHQVVYNAPDHEYQPIMSMYKENLKSYKRICQQKDYEKEIRVRSLSFRDNEEICDILIENMQLEWETCGSKKIQLSTQKSFEKLLSGQKGRKQPFE